MNTYNSWAHRQHSQSRTMREFLNHFNVPDARSEREPGNRGERRPIFGRVVVIRCLIGLMLLLSAGCQNYISDTFPSTAPGPKPGVLAVGDTIKIAFTTAPELNVTQKIESDGKVSLPLVGEVSAVGKSPAQLQQELTQLYKPQLQNSEVIVTLENVAIPVVVSGEVQKPGKIMFERPATVLEAVMEAGGFTAYGDPKRVSLIRQINGVQHMQIVDLSKVLRGEPTKVMYVNPGDVIYVRPKFISF